MPLDDGYGVLVGVLDSWDFNHVDHRSEYIHCNLMVRVGRKRYRCPVDLDSKQLADGIEWRLVEPAPELFDPVATLEDGWHYLRSEPGSGALDYYRSPGLAPTDCCRAASNGTALPGREDAWCHGTGKEAFAALEPLLRSARRVYVYGEPFRNRRGVHNIHQNQGDPPGSRWRRENGTWQDGAVVSVGNDGAPTAFLCKFKTQRFFPAPGATGAATEGKPCFGKE